jgi:hypothetical protein
MVDGYCTMGIIQNIGREVREVINVFGDYGDEGFIARLQVLSFHLMRLIPSIMIDID